MRPSLLLRAGLIFLATLLAGGASALMDEIVEREELYAGCTIGVPLSGSDGYGTSVTSLGDLVTTASSVNRDDVAVGIPHDDDTGTNQGSVCIVEVRISGFFVPKAKISEGVEGFVGPLPNDANFGAAVAGFAGQSSGHNPDDDPEIELFVGAPGHDTVWLLDLEPGSGSGVGEVQQEFVFDDTTSGLTVPAGSRFGDALAVLGDLDPLDAMDELAVAVGAPDDDDGQSDAGAVHLLFFNGDAKDLDDTELVRVQKLSSTAGGLPALAADGHFGSSVTSLGDLDGDGVTDIAVGQPEAAGGGAVHVLLLNADGTRKGGFVVDGSAPDLDLTVGDELGRSVAWLGDENGLGGGILAAGAPGYEGAVGTDRGGVWLATIDFDLTVSATELVTDGENWTASEPLSDGHRFGDGLASLGAFQGFDTLNVIPPPVIGVGTPGRNGLYLLDLDPCPQVIDGPLVYHSPLGDGTNPCVTVRLPDQPLSTLELYLDAGRDDSVNPPCQETPKPEGDELCAWDVRIEYEGYTVDAVRNLAPGALANQPSGAPDLRINWIVDAGGPALPSNGPIPIADVDFAQAAGADRRIEVVVGSAAVGADVGLLAVTSRPIAVPEPSRRLLLAAGIALLAWLPSRRSTRRAAAGLAVALSLLPVAPGHAVNSVKAHAKIAQNSGGLSGADTDERLGQALAVLGRHEGFFRVAVSSLRNDASGAIWTLYVGDDGELSFGNGVQGLTDSSGWAVAPPSFSSFGASLTRIAPIDANGTATIAIGQPGTFTGSLDVVRLREDGSGEFLHRITNLSGGFPDIVPAGGQFGRSMAVLGDMDFVPDGVDDWIVGAPFVNGETGRAYVLPMNPDFTVINAIETIDGAAVGAPSGARFGWSVAGIGDIDGNGVIDVAVGARSEAAAEGRVYVIRLQWNMAGTTLEPVPGGIVVIGGEGSLPLPYAQSPGTPFAANDEFGRSLAYLGEPTGQGGAVLAAGSLNDCGTVNVMHLRADGTVRTAYEIHRTSGVGFSAGDCLLPGNDGEAFGSALGVVGDVDGSGIAGVDGDEVPDLMVGAGEASHAGQRSGALFTLLVQDSDFDGLDDTLDNCPFAHNPEQVDGDGDFVGDLCDNCPDVVNPGQGNVDMDEEGDACEPVELQLQTTGTPASPSWDLFLACGAYTVTDVNAAIVLPAGSTAPQTLTLNGATVVTQSTSGPGLTSPQRTDAIYFSAGGAPLCTALGDVQLGTLTTGPIGGTQLAAAALTLEGVGTPGFGLNAAEDASGAVPLSDLRLVNGIPLPILDLELGPAVETASGTRWEVRIARSSDEFHRVAFGLIAPVGTGTGDFRWLGCDTTPNGSGERLCCDPGPCGDFDGIGIGTNANPNRSWTVGPQPTPAGTQLPDTLYVVLEGTAISNGLLDTLNPVSEGDYHVLGEVELSGVGAGLEPALTVDGANDIADPFSAGLVTPLEDVAGTARALSEVKLIGAFNPAADVDGDGIQDLGDNCPFQANPSQSNRGSFLDATDDTNQQGDACECAEATEDGAVLDPADFDQIRNFLLGTITDPVLAGEIEARCSVVGTTECNTRDLIVLRRALDDMDSSVALRCDAALSPPTP